MAENNREQTNEAGNKEGSETLKGQAPNGQRPESKQQGTQQESSAMDKQEGNMNHGEKGANFNEEGEKS